MAKIKKCLDKFGDDFSPSEKKTMLDAYEKLSKTESDLTASSKAVLPLFRSVFNQLNSLKAKLGLAQDEKVVFPDTAKIIEEINQKYSELEEVEGLESKKEIDPEKLKERRFIEKIRTMTDAYNEMTKAERQDEFGRDLYKRIDDLAKENNLEVFLSDGRIILKREDGTRVVRIGTKKSNQEIAQEKAQKEFRRKLLNESPEDIKMALLQAIATGMRFNIGQLKVVMNSKDIARMSPFLKAEKKGVDVVDLENLPLFLKEAGGPDLEGADAFDMWSDAGDLLSEFIGVTDFVEKAYDRLSIYGEELKKKQSDAEYNQGRSSAEMAYLENEERLLQEEMAADEESRARSEYDDRMAFEKEFDGIQQQKKSLEVKVKKQIEDFGVAKDQVNQVYGVISKVFQGIKDAGLTAAKTVGEWVNVGKGKEKPSSLFKDGQKESDFGGFQTRDGKPIGFKYDTDQVARERFDFSKLTKIGSGSDRDVYDLGNGKVLKVAKTARGLNQNVYEGDYYLKGIVPEVSERGLNYVVAENTPRLKSADKITIYDPETNEEVGESTAGQMLKDIAKFTQRDFDNKKSELQDVLAKYGFQDILSYDVLWNDFTAGRNWGYKDGLAMHSDGGTFGGVRMLDEYKGKTNLSDPEFKKIYDESKKLKKQFGDTDKATMYKKDSEEVQAQYRIENGKNIIEAIKDFDGSPKAVVALTHEIMHPTVVTIIDGAKQGNKVGLKHTKTIIDEFNKSTGNSLTMDELIAGNESFRDGKTTKQYREVQEFIAESWEKYHTEGGKGFSSAFQKVLSQITEAFKAVYRSVSGGEVSPGLRKFFDEILGKDEVSKINVAENTVTYKDALNAIKKAMPNVKVVESSSIDGAGQVEGNTLTINPEYAGLDTPIHEAGHIFIDAVGGLKDKTIAKGVAQLKDTKLWKEVSDEYPELNEEMLAKEVLAQAIGVEGAGIFDSVEKQAKFRQVLNYIFDKLKQLLGIDKNIAKSLARQIISGIGTKQMTGTTAEVQQAKYSKKKKSPEQIIIEKTIEEMEASDDLSAYSVDDLVSFVNYIIAADFAQENVRTALVNRVRTRIGLALKERGIAEAEKAGEKVDLRKAAAKDIGWYDKFGKILSHFDNMFPDMKEFSKIWNSAFFNKMKEGKAEKLTHNELASKVIQEYNKKMGILDRGKLAVGQVLGQQNHKYFSFLDKGDGKLISEKEARAKGFSKNQIDYIKYVRELIAKRQELAPEDPYNDEMDVLKLDKGFYEKFQTEGLVSALSNFVGTEDNLLNTRIEFVNPNTGKSQTASFGEIQVALQKYADKGLLEKAKAVGMLVKYGYKAKMQLKEDIDRGLVKKRGRGEYTLDDNGNLKSRFDTKRDENRSYSRDFYSAVNMYIDDTMHVKHISKVAQIANSLEYLAEKGAINSQGEKIQESKKNLAQYMKMWTDLHVLQRPNENNPTLDKILKGVRFLSSATTMWFNVPVNILNVAIGNYNNWRDTDGKTWALGQKRLFGKGPRSVKAGAGLINKYAADIVDKYVAVTTDFDSNPVMTGRDALSKLAMLGQKWGEFQIQASGLLGLMDEKDYNSFEYKKNKYGVDELVVKEGVDEKELESKILSLMDKVSDVQGKYSSKDRMNILNNEMGKIALQYRVWMPAWFRTRFNKETGSYNLGLTRFLRDGCKQLRQDIANGNWEALSKNKVFAQNLKGLMTLGFLAALVYNDDEDEEKSMLSKLYQRALSDVLFIFEPDNLKFTLSKPIAAMGAVDKLITIADHLFAIEEDDFYEKAGKYGEEGDSKLRGDIMGILPGRKVIDMLDDEE